MNLKVRFGALASALLLGGCFVTPSEPEEPRAAPTASPSPEADDASGDGVVLEQVEAPLQHSETSQVVARALPSIVNIKVTTFDDAVLGRETKGEGSGVVISRSGIILTNWHVVRRATEVRVVFNDGEHDALDGTVVGIDSDRDIGVVRVKADDLNAIELGTSEALQLGDDLIAVGYPLDLGGVTVTKGILSARGRTVKVRDPSTIGTRTFRGLLQTDAAINPGNSGGGLLDSNGRLIGINSAAAPAAFAENIGFAIPIDAALPVIEEILDRPVDERAWLGVSVGDATSETLEEFGIDPEVRGAVVVETLSGSPAEEAGIETGEVITSIDGRDIDTADDLIEALATMNPGDEVEVVVAGASGRRSEDIILDQRPVTLEESED